MPPNAPIFFGHRATFWQKPPGQGQDLPSRVPQGTLLTHSPMKHYKLRYQFYNVRASHKEEAIRKAVEMIKRDPEGFVIDADEPTPTDLKGLGRMLITGK
jgi:hypothetical protein